MYAQALERLARRANQPPNLLTEFLPMGQDYSLFVVDHDDPEEASSMAISLPVEVPDPQEIAQLLKELPGRTLAEVTAQAVYAGLLDFNIPWSRTMRLVVALLLERKQITSWELELMQAPVVLVVYQNRMVEVWVEDLADA